MRISGMATNKAEVDYHLVYLIELAIIWVNELVWHVMVLSYMMRAFVACLIYFRLVVIAEKNKVHSEFPIPLINRLEKHYVSATSLLSDTQKKLKEDLEKWTKLFVKPLRSLQ